MKTVGTLIKRNVKLFFKDKGTFFTALITPIILLVLYVTFLYNVYEESFISSVPEEVVFDGKVIKGLVGGLLLSSLLAVSAITVPFCANLCMVADKVSGARRDLSVAPVKPRHLAFGYYLSTVVVGLIVNFVAALLGFVYLACVGWYLSVLDVVRLLTDICLSTLFGTALSSLICYPLTTQGQISAVGSIVSSGYGFICGAYMPMSQFPVALQKILGFFPGTYGTSLFRNHALRGVCTEMRNGQGFSDDVIAVIRGVADCDLKFFGHAVQIWQAYLVLILSAVLLLGAYVLLNVRAAKKAAK